MMNKDDKLIYLTLTNADSLKLLRTIDSAKQEQKNASYLGYSADENDQQKYRRLLKSVQYKYQHVGYVLSDQLTVHPTKLDRPAAISIWNSALAKGLPSDKLIDLLYRLQLQVTGRLSDPIGFFLREPSHELLLKRQEIDRIQSSSSRNLKGNLFPVESEDIFLRKRRVLLSELLDALQDRLGITAVRERETQVAGLDTRNDELRSVFTCKGCTVVISVL